MKNKIFELVVAVFIVFIITKPSPNVLPPVKQGDFQRLQVLLSGWGIKPPPPKVYLAGDLNRDYIVDFKDFSILANNWLKVDLVWIANKWIE